MFGIIQDDIQYYVVAEARKHGEWRFNKSSLKSS